MIAPPALLGRYLSIGSDQAVGRNRTKPWAGTDQAVGRNRTRIGKTKNKVEMLAVVLGSRADSGVLGQPVLWQTRGDARSAACCGKMATC